MSKSEPPRGPDPERIREQAAMRGPLSKRFYKDVSVRHDEEGWSVLLDGRSVKTPGKRSLSLPTEALADAVAAEWRAQDKVIDPATMPVTRIANTAIEGVTDRMSEVAADIVAFAGSDLLCYRAAGPEALVARQSAAWNPVVLWVRSDLRADFNVVTGVMPIAQPDEALARIAEVVQPLTVFELSGLHVATTLTGSALLALAVLRVRLLPEQAWAAAHVDEDYQIELWGTDEEAAQRRASRWQEMQAACLIMREAT
jgi:chaperone required for assembly of F1-ATPase